MTAAMKAGSKMAARSMIICDEPLVLTTVLYSLSVD